MNSMFWEWSTVGEQGCEKDENFSTEAQEMIYEEATVVTRKSPALNSQVSSRTKCHTTVEDDRLRICEFANLRQSLSRLPRVPMAYCLLPMAYVLLPIIYCVSPCL